MKQDGNSQTVSLAVTGQDEDSQVVTTDTSEGSAADTATSGGSTVVTVSLTVTCTGVKSIHIHYSDRSIDTRV